jgi:hypothetical protein
MAVTADTDQPRRFTHLVSECSSNLIRFYIYMKDRLEQRMHKPRRGKSLKCFTELA